MRIEELPDSYLVTTTCSVEVMTVALRSILGPHFCVTHMAPVYGEPQSIRIMCEWQYGDTIELPRPLSAWLAANHLQKLAEREARYDPPKNPEFQKGWEIRKMKVGKKCVAIAIARWVC